MDTVQPRPRSRATLLFSAVVFVALASADVAQSGEAYYVIVLASQRTPNDPNYAHTFATFVRTTWPGDGPCPGPCWVEFHTISWLPRNLKIRLGALLPECGSNVGLLESIRFAQATDQRVSLWGPYQIEPDLYCRALRQIRHLESDEVRYKANDFGYPSAEVSNCIHAVGDTVGGLRIRVLSPGWGEVASYAVLLRMTPWIIDEDRVHPWVGSALGLDAFPIHYRDREPPLSGTFLGPINRILGGERDLCPSYGPPHR